MDKFFASKPHGYWSLIKRSVSLYNAGFTKAFPYSLLFAIVVFIPRLLSDYMGQPIFSHPEIISWQHILFAAVNLVAVIFFIAILWHMNCVAKGIREPLVQDFAVGIKKFIYVIIATLIANLIIIAAILLMYKSLILLHEYQILKMPGHPGFVLTAVFIVLQFFLILYLCILFIFLMPLIATENKSIIGSLERSVSLGWNHWWRILSTQLSPWVCYFLILEFIHNVLRINVHIYLTEFGPHPLWAVIVNIIVFAIFFPWVPALLLVQLRDLELRKMKRS